MNVSAIKDKVSMKKIILPFLLLLCGMSISAQKENIVKVACVGNSITFGSGIQNRDSASYPAVLGRMLGEGYEVRNFGFSARTLLLDGDRPYMKEEMYKEMLSSHPDIVVIKLGTNDSKPQNWKHKDSFESDLRKMVSEIRGLSPTPKLFLCYPAKAYAVQWGINDSIIAGEVIPRIRKVASEEKIEIIDLHTATDGMPENFPDKIHPNEKGALRIAETVYKALMTKEEEEL